MIVTKIDRDTKTPDRSNKIRSGNEFIRTYTGLKFWPLEARKYEINILDIAHALSNICRFTGHCKEFYSVAQHSIYVSSILPKKYQFWGLMHDASEAYLCDISRPIKHSKEMAGYRKAEEKLMSIIASKFGLIMPMPDIIHTADIKMLAAELRDLMPADDWINWSEPAPFTVKPCSPSIAEKLFLEKFEELYNVK